MFSSSKIHYQKPMWNQCEICILTWKENGANYRGDESSIGGSLIRIHTSLSQWAKPSWLRLPSSNCLLLRFHGDFINRPHWACVVLLQDRFSLSLSSLSVRDRHVDLLLLLLLFPVKISPDRDASSTLRHLWLCY